MKSYILTEKEKAVLVQFTSHPSYEELFMSGKDRALLATLKRRIRLYYENLRKDLDLVEEVRAKWRKQ